MFYNIAKYRYIGKSGILKDNHNFICNEQTLLKVSKTKFFTVYKVEYELY